LSNTDRDSIFPLDGVLRIFQSTKRVYERFDASEKFALNITAGGHLDSQELQMQAIRWFDQHLMKTDRKIDKAAVSFFEPEQLRVFDKLPEDQINTKIDELFVPAASSPEIPADKAAWKEQSDAWRANLRERVFRQWPSDYQMRDQPANTFTQSDRDVQTRPPRQGLVTNNGKLELRPFGFTSQALAASGAFQGEFSAGYAISLDLFVLSKPGLVLPETVVVHVLDEPAWQEFLAKVGHKFEDTFPNVKLPPVDEAGYRELEQALTEQNVVHVYFAPRGYGPTLVNQDERAMTHFRRRFTLLGQTHDGMAAFDVRRAVQAVRKIDRFQEGKLRLQSQGQMAGITLAAALFEPDIEQLDLYDLPSSLRQGPFFMNAQRYLDTPELVALAAENTRVSLYQKEPTGWKFPQELAERLEWEAQQFQVHIAPAAR
jgi:hypothetical protein